MFTQAAKGVPPEFSQAFGFAFQRKLEFGENTRIEDALAAAGISATKENITKFKEFFPSMLAAQDFIITKSGQVIKTDPQDTIMGFKGAMPSTSGNFTSNITINANISNDMDIRRIANEITEIQSQEFGRRAV